MIHGNAVVAADEGRRVFGRDRADGVRRLARGGALVLAFVATAIAATWPLVRHAAESLPAEARDPLLNAWILAWDAGRARHLLDGVWDAPILYPYWHTLAFSEHLFGIAVFTTPIQWLSQNPILTYNCAFLASYVLAGAGMYLLVHELTGRTDASIVAALAFELCPYRLAQLSRLQIEMAGWMPIALWALHRYGRTARFRWIAVATAAFCLQGLSNGYYLYFLAPPVIIVGVWIAITRLRPMRVAAHAAIAAAAVAVVFLPIARVYVDVRQRYDLRRSVEDNARFSADVGSYLHVTPSLAAHFRPAAMLPAFTKPDTPLETKEGELFPGFVPLVMTLVALASVRWRRRTDPVAPYALIGAVAFVLSLGPQPTAWGHPFWSASPYRALFVVVPGLDGLRVPARLGIVVILSVCVLGGLGTARLLSRWRAPARFLFVVLSAAIMFADTSAGPLPLARIGRHGRLAERSIYERIAAGPPGAVLELPVGRMDYDYRGFRYAYATLIHGRPLINGWTGYSTPLQQFLGGPASPLRDIGRFDSALDFLEGLGVRYVVLRPADFEDAALARDIGSALDARPLRARRIDTWDAIVAYELPDSRSPEAADARPEVAISAAGASRAADRVRFAFDRDLDTRWTTGMAQAGDEWIRFQFAAPVLPSRVIFGVHARSLGDYPRWLEITSACESRTQTLFAGSVLDALGQAIRRAPHDIRMRVTLGTTEDQCAAANLQLRQLGTTADWFWSIDEIAIEQ